MESGTSLERMVFFSDAVFAIALTLLALDLKLPAGIPAEGLDDALVAALPQLLAYALSFLIIARTWMSHRSDFTRIRGFNVTLGRLNLALLFFIAMLPGPTSVLSEYGDDPTPWPSVLYAANIAAVYLTMAAIWGYSKHAGLLEREGAADGHGKVFNIRLAGALVFLRFRRPLSSPPTHRSCGCCSYRRLGRPAVFLPDHGPRPPHMSASTDPGFSMASAT
ncbi:TMEM175 family protein [Arthrobacter sp. UYCu712]|uniref:TMEM175 family protein n=1 Tax=Arthrobacter sp. UYCu712 TaxID=3156340 RepID=UPI00339ABE88